jgi:hypothetical protein
MSPASTIKLESSSGWTGGQKNTRHSRWAFSFPYLGVFLLVCGGHGGLNCSSQVLGMADVKVQLLPSPQPTPL